MELIIKGKRSEGKSFLACLIEDLLIQAGYVVRLTEADGNKKREVHQQGADIDYRLRLGFIRNVNITVAQDTQLLWDGRIVVDHQAMVAERRYRQINPKLYEGENDGT